MVKWKREEICWKDFKEFVELLGGRDNQALGMNLDSVGETQNYATEMSAVMATAKLRDRFAYLMNPCPSVLDIKVSGRMRIWTSS